jgi:beta-N-acetylhexosaminidase
VMSALSPVYLRETPWIRSALAVYGTSAESFRAGFSVLAGDFLPEGRLPVDFLDAPSEGGTPESSAPQPQDPEAGTRP